VALERYGGAGGRRLAASGCGWRARGDLNGRCSSLVTAEHQIRSKTAKNRQVVLPRYKYTTGGVLRQDTEINDFLHSLKA
jgi:hypothetical protein